MPSIEQKILSGGVKVVLVTDKNFKRNTASICFDIGRNTTTHREFSALHILEHLILEGNDDHPSPQEQLFKNNSEVNGEVNNEVIRFWITARQDDFYDNLEILSRLILKPTLNDLRLSQEKKVLAEELQEGLQSIEVVIGQRIEATLWPNSMYGQLEQAYESIQEITLEDLERVEQKLTKESKVLIILAGDFDKNRTLRLIERYWGSLKVQLAVKQDKLELAANLPQLSVIPTNFDQSICQIAYGYQKETEDRRTVALGLLNAYLSHPGLGLLTTELREKRKLVYSAQSWLEPSRTRGSFMIDTKFNNQKTKELTATLFELINRLEEGGVDKEKFEHIRISLIAALDEDSSEPEFWVYFLESTGLLDKDVTKDFDNYREILQELTATEVVKEAKILFQPKNLVIVVAGPYMPYEVEELKKYLLEILGTNVGCDTQTERYISWSRGVAARIRSLFGRKK
ncbi:MAG: pitrilysin family protein [Patescibacteria group bacterium]